MRGSILNPGLLVLAVLLTGGQSSAAPQETAFTYQGQLEQAGVPVDGALDVLFQLYDSEVGPS
jgi:hypothetical protein